MVTTCADCRKILHQQRVPALSGEFRMVVVWANLDGEWICPVTGDEHRRAVQDRS